MCYSPEMVKNLSSRSDFAVLCGVSPAAITKACKGRLSKALVGKRVDLNHADAIAYCTDKLADAAPAPATGIDPLYEKAVASGKRTANALRSELGVGGARAARIVDMMRAAGLTAPDSEVAFGFEMPASPVTEPHVPRRIASGHTAARTTKKDEALQNLVDRGEMIHEIPEDIQAFADMTLRELIQRYGTEMAFCDWLTATKHIEMINEKRLKNAEAEGKLVSRELVKVGIIEPIDSAHIKLLTDGARTIARRLTAKHDAGEPLEVLEKFVAEQITSFIRPVKAKVARALRDA